MEDTRQRKKQVYKMKKLVLKTIRYCSLDNDDDLMNVVPSEILSLSVDNPDNFYRIMKRLAETRKEKEEELARLIGLNENWQKRIMDRRKFTAVLKRKEKHPSPEVERKKREICFMSALIYACVNFLANQENNL